jgi:hypothetical protein
MISRLRCVCIAAVLVSTRANAQQLDDAEANYLANARELEPASFVRAVLRVNPSIEAARQSWRAALARVKQAGAFDDPMVEASAPPGVASASRSASARRCRGSANARSSER